ncbi:MAG TPA: ATPase, T2SS/T4P/T4SS family, partial [Candidatus Eremiobacteraceae bacterium]|nr:ATPase, T2SS/T4P/T4SS family [Candidatus Eremiobacteraceae bacterium]
MKRAVRDQERAQRRYQRRRIKLPVSLRTDDGATAEGTASDISAGGMRLSTLADFAIGTRGLAQIAIPSGEQVRAPIEVVWRETGPEGATTYGVHFQNLGSSERFSLFEAIYSPANGEQVFAKPIDGEVRPIGAEPLTPAHHTYYMRVVRRIEQTHKLSPLDTDKLLFARLHEGRSLREAIVDFGLASYEKLEEYLSAIFGVPYIDLSRNRPDPNASDTIPVSIATTGYIVPVKLEGDKLTVAMADPLDLPTLDLILLRAKHQVEIRFALIEDVEKAINEIYHGTTLYSVDRLLQGLPTVSADGLAQEGSEIEDLEALRKMSDATPIVSLVESILRTATEYKASDIHLEPYPDTVRVRFRLDGVLQEMRKLPRPIYPAVVSRIKIMARMDITIR